MISRTSTLLLGLCVSALAAFAMAAPLWYIASTRRTLFNILFVILTVGALIVAVARRVSRPRTARRRKARPEPS